MSDQSSERTSASQERLDDDGRGADPWSTFGRYLKTQRQLAQLSLRQLAELTRISNPYLSQIERGLHQPSVHVIRALADALSLSPEDLLAQAAGLDREPGSGIDTEAAIRRDPQLDDEQKKALLAVYRSMTKAPRTAPKRPRRTG